ncbi:hypothetical protein [Allonocardiopsis opalescens]|uniref:Uncharacterized protein n=1 Tax=Allonocardiopsis opalescens TaxID=1144618 RepID=A0A2T0PSZ7_9ACTN|nr:hypothetical protein [Allonocardiopsis opalescens]PRX92020.1 hypothetical protein CLV72_11293 [Allonocardiopsis opalescens]
MSKYGLYFDDQPEPHLEQTFDTRDEAERVAREFNASRPTWGEPTRVYVEEIH